jgi:HEAT repeat protein
LRETEGQCPQVSHAPRIGSKLLARDDLSGITLVENALLHPSPLESQLLPVLSGSIAGLKNPESVPTLARLVAAHNPDITKNAAIALRRSGSTDAIEPLTQLLTNEDPLIVYYAVAGLGDITKQDDWTPSYEEFMQNRKKYVTYWGNWVRSNVRHSTVD